MKKLPCIKPAQEWLVEQNQELPQFYPLFPFNRFKIDNEEIQIFKIILFPAWPDEWDVDFKLHVPGNTVVEGKFRKGKIESLKVIPKERRNDIILYNK